MKKKLFKLLSVLFSAIIIFNSCSNNNQKLFTEEPKFVIEDADTEDCCIVTDLMYERMYIGDKLIMFTYGASKSTPANLLTELIIGCSDLKILKFDDYELKPTGAIYRKKMEDFVEIDKRQE